ncbi:MAG: adenylosuccinate lyase [Deltaproteobacteria bacterium]|nr:adenylosuccinate lyase [Deltaproteobacteria bacterium]
MIGRYKTTAIDAIWRDEGIFSRWTQVEVAACEAWHARGEIPNTEMSQIKERASTPDPQRVRELEKITDHDVVAFVRALAEIVGEPANRHLHRGLTSSDVVDTGLALAMLASLDVVLDALKSLSQAVATRAREHKLTPCVGRTHGVHAEPTTYGIRLAGWYTEIQRNIERLTNAKSEIGFGKLSGAVGTFSQSDPEFEGFVLERLKLAAEPVATQVVPRDRHASVIAKLALLAGGLERFATDIRALQRTEVHEAEEAFAKGQTGSSAMPHKKNPITSERLCGMSRLMRGYALAAFEDIALWHERDISHSSVERIAFPDAFHLALYMTERMTKLVQNLRIYKEQMQHNLDLTGGLVFSQNALGLLLRAGMDRQAAYALVQTAALRVWEKQSPTLQAALWNTPEVRQLVCENDLAQAFDLSAYNRHVDAIFSRAGL